jgi:hypothetical protein
MKPDYLFEVWSPDDVAECMGGVNGALYARLWSLVPMLPRVTADDETPDTRFKRALVHVWHHLSPVEQSELNLLAEQHVARERAMLDD